MNRTYRIFGWGLVVLGALHMATTFRAFDAPSSAAVWFFGAGIAMSLSGALNLLNATYGRSAPGLRRTTIGANLAMIAYGAAAGLASRASLIEIVVIVGWVAATAALSLATARANAPTA